ncbi:MAG: RND transporter, partial [Oscillospiraceae bacterium]|nr:RND transporter [Oscillospiraceae bacterium]
VDRGYSLSFTVTSEQAARVRVGDNAEVDRGWWGGWSDEIRAALIGIRNDPQNPATSRILQFAISGDVESGSQLNINLSERSENFSIIVPNSAIRTDTNGDFVLVVISRSSPLGNRYIATRADVNVMASDDTNPAVSGALTTWDFVITRASAPIEPGMQVRLADNP